jgi:hypothetical protein
MKVSLPVAFPLHEHGAPEFIIIARAETGRFAGGRQTKPVWQLESRTCYLHGCINVPIYNSIIFIRAARAIRQIAYYEPKWMRFCRRAHSLRLGRQKYRSRHGIAM